MCHQSIVSTLFVAIITFLRISTAAASESALTDEELYKRNAPSVVLLMGNNSLGSGVILNKNMILTNWHVIKDSPRVKIMFKRKNENDANENPLITEGMVIRYNQIKDLALVMVESIPDGYKAVHLGTNQDIFVAEKVHAIGHPKGKIWTYNQGVISQIRDNYEWADEEGNHKADVIQTQTPINPGNSGGPLFAQNGKLIGINSFKSTDADLLNFSISLSSIQEFLSEKESISFKDKVSNRAKLLELAFIIEKFLPEKGNSYIYWDHESDNPLILWDERGVTSYEKTSDFKKDDSPFQRVGYTFITAAGKQYFVLKSKKEPLPWTIKMAGPRAFVDRITFSPAAEGFANTAGSGTEIPFAEAMALNANIKLRSICSAKSLGANYEYYSISTKNSEEVLLEFSSNYSAIASFDEVSLYLMEPTIESVKSVLPDHLEQLIIDGVEYNLDTKAVIGKGNAVTFGRWEQDGNFANGPEPIEWMVVEQGNGSVLLVSKRTLTVMPYNYKASNVTWETCSLRHWLNGDFYAKAFTSQEKAQIVFATVPAEGNPQTGTYPGNSTKDYVFIPSLGEAQRWFSSNDMRACQPSNVVAHNTSYIRNGISPWWLRTPGIDNKNVTLVDQKGRIYAKGGPVHDKKAPVRVCVRVQGQR